MLVDTATLSDSLTADLSWADLARAVPSACLLGSDRLSAVVTAAGTGAVVFDGNDLTRFRADGVLDADGLFVYLRDADSGRIWSAGRQPTGVVPDDYRARLGDGTVCIERLDDGLRTTTEWTASAGALRVDLADKDAVYEALDDAGDHPPEEAPLKPSRR